MKEKLEHVFVDTNILLYAFDVTENIKQKIAAKIVSDLWDRPYPPAISLQVLQEFYVNLRKKKIAPKVCQELIELYMRWEVVEPDSNLFLKAIHISETNKISLWDGLIVAAASRAKASVLLSEDLSHGQKIEGVSIRNPFV